MTTLLSHTLYTSISSWEFVEWNSVWKWPIVLGNNAYLTPCPSTLVGWVWRGVDGHRFAAEVCGGNGHPVDLQHAFKVFLYTQHRIPTTVKYRLATLYCCLTCG